MSRDCLGLVTRRGPSCAKGGVLRYGDEHREAGCKQGGQDAWTWLEAVGVSNWKSTCNLLFHNNLCHRTRATGMTSASDGGDDY